MNVVNAPREAGLRLRKHLISENVEQVHFSVVTNKEVILISISASIYSSNTDSEYFYCSKNAVFNEILCITIVTITGNGTVLTTDFKTNSEWSS